MEWDPRRVIFSNFSHSFQKIWFENCIEMHNKKNEILKRRRGRSWWTVAHGHGNYYKKKKNKNEKKLFDLSICRISVNRPDLTNLLYMYFVQHVKIESEIIV